jgi:hypothetical protein
MLSPTRSEGQAFSTTLAPPSDLLLRFQHIGHAICEQIIFARHLPFIRLVTYPRCGLGARCKNGWGLGNRPTPMLQSRSQSNVRSFALRGPHPRPCLGGALMAEPLRLVLSHWILPLPRRMNRADPVRCRVEPRQGTDCPPLMYCQEPISEREGYDWHCFRS